MAAGSGFGINAAPSLDVALVSNRVGGVERIHVYPPLPPPPFRLDTSIALLMMAGLGTRDRKFSIFCIM